MTRELLLSLQDVTYDRRTFPRYCGTARAACPALRSRITASAGKGKVTTLKIAGEFSPSHLMRKYRIRWTMTPEERRGGTITKAQDNKKVNHILERPKNEGKQYESSELSFSPSENLWKGKP